MEWREQSAVSCEEAFSEAQRWIEAVTKKKFGNNDFRSALENGVLLCDLINRIKPGVIRKINRLPTPIAGLDNLNVFLKACGKLGLKEAQLFHPGDLQDLSSRVTVKDQESNRRLKNVLITVYWLGRRAQSDRLYDGPYLNFKAFEGLLGTALYKSLHESSKGGNVRDSGFGESWYSEREELHGLREEEGGGGGGGGGGHRRDDSLDSLDSLGSRPHSTSSDTTLKGSSEGCCSDTKVDSVFKMAENRDTSYRRSVSITPKASAPFNQFLPTKDKQSGYVPAPLRKKRAERSDDNRRSWTNAPYPEEEGALTRQPQTQESIDGSKSTSDIHADPAVSRQTRYEELQKYREMIKESDDQWQDDLSKWKNRRRSVNSDIVKKKEEREMIEQITHSNSNSNRRSKTFKEMQEERENKGNSVGSRFRSLSYLDDDEDVFEKPVTSPRTRTLPARSFTIDAPFSSSEPSLREEAPAPGRAASPASSQEEDTVDRPAGRVSSSSRVTPSIPPSITPRSVHGSQPAAADPEPKSPVPESRTDDTFSSSLPKVPARRGSSLAPQTVVEAPSSGSLFKQQPQTGSMEPKPPGTSRVSASLPRSYQRSDGTRISSVVTPRPFGTQSSRIASLPRASTTDESLKPVNGDTDVSKKSSVPSRYQQFMTSEDEAQSQSSSAHSSEDEEEEENKTTPKRIMSTQSVSPVPPLLRSEIPVSPAPTKETSTEDFCEMRISLNQKPNSSRDFGFQAAWDSTGARVTSIQPGSPAEMCQLQVGDEVLAVNKQQVADMSYTDWKTCLEEALQEGSLVMDIRRHGKNSSPDHVLSSSLDFTSRSSLEKLPSKEAAVHPIIDVASNGVNGGFQEEPVTMRSKGGPESVMPDIPVPALTPSSSRWSWDPEEERRRQEKWQKEQERLLQEKYKRDQEKLQEEWHRAQEEISKSRAQQQPGSLEVNSLSPHSPDSHTITPPWEEEERKRKEQEEQEEQERQRQAEERRKREEEERELQRLQQERMRRERELEEERMREREAEEERMRREREAEEERMRREREAEEERMRREREAEEERKRRGEELREQRRREEEREEERRRQEAWEQQQRERQRASEQQQQQRTKSKSSPQLDEEDRPQRRVSGSGAPDRKGQPPSSQAEAERQQILNEMKKKTPLLTDTSWIRQRSSEPPASRDPDMPPMRRGESLDNLDSSYNPWRSSWTPRNSSSIPNYTRPHSALSGSVNSFQGWSGAQRPGSSTLPSSYSMGSLRGGAGTPTTPWSRQSTSPSLSSPSPTPSPEPTSESGAQQRSSASTVGLTSGDRKPGLKSEYETSSSTVTPATCDSKLVSPPPCDLSVLQQIDEETTCDNNP